MTDLVLVLNAGSSSIKFSIFAVAGAALELLVRGQVEGLFTRPRFAARNAADEVLSEQSWDEGTNLGHDGALEHLTGFVHGALSGHRLAGVGHRVVHGGP